MLGLLIYFVAVLALQHIKELPRPISLPSPILTPDVDVDRRIPYIRLCYRFEGLMCLSLQNFFHNHYQFQSD